MCINTVRLRLIAGLAGLCLMSACADGTARPPGTDAGAKAAAPTVRADYATYTDHFVALQSAALKGDYPGFAGHLKSANPQTVVTLLQSNFAGRPFDVYTAQARTSATDHRRVVELRGTGGRLYLFLVLDKVTGGWKVTSYEIDRNRNAIVTRL